MPQTVADGTGREIPLTSIRLRGNTDAESEQKGIAKYFVPPSTIRDFIPIEYRL
jgi:hypothetical protein